MEPTVVVQGAGAAGQVGAGVDVPGRVTGCRRLLRRFARDRAAVAAALFLLLLVATALLATVVAPHDPSTQDLVHAYQGPSAAHLLGTDELGRDELSRMIAATRTSLLAILEAMSIAVLLGVPVGLAAGYLGRWVDAVIMRVTDLLFALPALVLVMLVIAVLGTGLVPAMAALGIVFSTGFVRITRSAVVAIRAESYVTAATVVGLPRRAIVLRHVLPNTLGPIVVQIVMQAGVVLTVEASLSFIGLGVQPPDASWGTLLATAATNITGADSLLIVWPGVAITLTVLALNLVGDALLDAIGTAGRPARRERRRWRRRNAPVDPAPTAVAAACPIAPPEQAPLLEVRGLTVVAGDVPVVSDVSFSVRAGEVVGLVGESGCGKSTVALALTGLLGDERRIAAGSVRLAGRELVGLSPAALRKARGQDVAMVFQDPLASLNPSMTVGDQVAEPLRLAGQGRRAARRAAVDLLARVGVPDAPRRAQAYPHQFSGGMAQRVMIAMAIAGRPKLLIADEPVTALDVCVREQVLDLLLDLRAEFDMAVLLVTHDLGVVADACDRTLVAYAGELVEQAPSEALFAGPRHPYTARLLGARPVALSDEPLATIPGSVPLPGQWPTGCRFAPRCAVARPQCTSGPVAVALAGTDHLARCVRWEEGPWT
jgi:peptide/nickel transport system permease protein